MSGVLKVAVPTDDGRTISGHFGRAAGFLVYSIREGRSTGSELRSSPPHPEGHGGHHAALTALLGDCRAVITRSIGGPMAMALHEGGVKLYFTERALADEAVEDLLGDRLAEVDPRELPASGHHHLH